MKAIDIDRFEAFCEWMLKLKGYHICPRPLAKNTVLRLYKNTGIGRKWLVITESGDQWLVKDVDFNLYAEFLRWQSQVT